MSPIRRFKELSSVGRLGAISAALLGIAIGMSITVVVLILVVP